ncbi:Leucoanthocyanidin reductase [Bienertia sinuspersici]
MSLHPYGRRRLIVIFLELQSQKKIYLMLLMMRIPESIVAAFTHDIFIQGCQINFALDKPTDIEATSLYPDTPFRSLDECFDDFVSMIIDEHVMVDKPANGSADGIKLPGSEAYAITLSVA